MSFEAVSCGLRLRPTKVEWNLDHLQDVKESLTGVWRMFEWMPFKWLSYEDESSTVYGYVLNLAPEMMFYLSKIVSFHKGQGRKIKPGQKVHSSVAFCDERYHPSAILPDQGCLYELVGKGSRSNTEWVKGWEDLIEMDIFDLSLMSDVVEKLKSGTKGGSSMWVYRLTAMTSTGGHLFTLERAFLTAKHRGRSNRLARETKRRSRTSSDLYLCWPTSRGSEMCNRDFGEIIERSQWVHNLFMPENFFKMS